MAHDLKDLVRQLIPLLGDKQAQLADVLGTTQPTVSRWLKGSKPDGEMRDKIIELSKSKGLIAVPEQRRSRSASATRFTAIPIITWISAGALTNNAALSQDKISEIAVADLGEGDFFGLKVEGTSMDRFSPADSIIIVNRAQRTLVEGKPYVFAYRGEATYKLWRNNPARLAPFSSDPSNEIHFIDKRNLLYVLGRVRRSILDL